MFMLGRMIGFAAFLATALLLVACGGGESVREKSPEMPVSVSPGTLSTSFGSIAEAAHEAAAAVPVRGSVTQSSNAGGGVTRDTARVEFAAGGDIALRVTRDNGGQWDISSGDDALVGWLWSEDDSDIDGQGPAGIRIFSIENEQSGGDKTRVGLMTTRRAHVGGLAPGAIELHPGEGSDEFAHILDAGGLISLLYALLWTATDGVGFGETEAGPAWFAECTGADGCLAEDGILTEGVLRLSRDGPPSVVEWDDTDNEYISLGWWLHSPEAAGPTAQPEIGVFANGGHPFTEFAAASGTASYAGLAYAFAMSDDARRCPSPSECVGVFAPDESPDAEELFSLSIRVDEGELPLEGSVELTVDFDAYTVGGRVRLEANPDNHDDTGESAAPQPLVLTLEQAQIDELLPGGFFTGDTSSAAQSSVSGLSGKWGGQFFGAPHPELSSQPPQALGTFGGRKEDFSVLGVFAGFNGAEVEESEPEVMPQ